VLVYQYESILLLYLTTFNHYQQLSNYCVKSLSDLYRITIELLSNLYRIFIGLQSNHYRTFIRLLVVRLILVEDGLIKVDDNSIMFGSGLYFCKILIVYPVYSSVKDHVNTDMFYDDFCELCHNYWQQKYGFILIDKHNALDG